MTIGSSTPRKPMLTVIAPAPDEFQAWVPPRCRKQNTKHTEWMEGYANPWEVTHRLYVGFDEMIELAVRAT